MARYANQGNDMTIHMITQKTTTLPLHSGTLTIELMPDGSACLWYETPSGELEVYEAIEPHQVETIREGLKW